MSQRFRLYATAFVLIALFIPLKIHSQDSKLTPSRPGNISESELDRLALHPNWLKLLHYRKKWGQWQSYADGSGFFLTQEGSQNPKAELSAHVNRIFADDFLTGKLECQFPARFHWLRNELHISQESVPIAECEEFEVFRKQMSADSISLVFASFHPEHPASLFGHAMLKFNLQNGEDEVSLAYVAKIPHSIDPFSYVYKGLAGGFPGTFEIVKYNFTIRDNNEVQNRGLWEYELNLNKSEIDQLVRHLWEMKQTYFDYYFTDENCAFRMWTVIEAVRPDLNLSTPKPLVVTPSEVIQRIVNVDGMIQTVRYRPAIRERYMHKMRFLSPEEKRVFRQMSLGYASSEFENFSDLKQKQIYDIMIDYAIVRRKDPQNELTENEKSVLNDLYERRGNDETLHKIPGYFQMDLSSNPVFGHHPSQFANYVGNSSHGFFYEMALRPVLRDLTDPYWGYSRYMQLSFLKTRIRKYENSPNNIELRELQFIQMTSLNPLANYLFKPSWFLDIGLRSIYSETPYTKRSNSLYGYLDAGPGISLEFFHKWILFHSFFRARADFGSVFERDVRLGYVFSNGFLFRITEQISLLTTANLRNYEIGSKNRYPEIASQLTVQVWEKLALDIGTNYLIQSRLYDWQIGIKLYF